MSLVFSSARTAFFLCVLTVCAEAAETPRGGRVGWARLIAPNSDWAIHSDHDPELAAFIRQETSLNIDPIWYTVDPADLDRLCAYPYVYAKNLMRYSGARERDHLREFVQRGGFVFVDPCFASNSAERMSTFVQRHTEWFKRLFPEIEVRLLPASHPFFRCDFSVGLDDIHTADMVRLGATKPSELKIYGVFRGERMIGAISLSGLECGWPQTPQRKPGCMKMIVNSYVYAMTR